MAVTKVAEINLDLAAVSNREDRLGSIISWDGSASQLVALSGNQSEHRNVAAPRITISKQEYAEKKGACGDCSGKGTGCNIEELKMPFNQQTMCSHAIVTCQVGNTTDCVLIEHSPIGCSATHPRYDQGYKIGLLRRNKPYDSIKAFSTNLLENDMIFGATDKLRQTCRDAKRRFNPKAIFISMSCSTAIIGEDLESVSMKMEEELGIPVIPLHCEGFRSKHWSTGFDISQHGVMRQIVNKKPHTQKDLINIIALWGTDYFTELLQPLGLRVNYLIDMASFDEMKQASEAVVSATFCHTLGSYMATALEQNYGVPQIESPQPYGIAATDYWLRAVGKAVGKEAEAETYIAEQHARILPQIAELREKLKGVKGFIATGSAYAHGLISVLRELGIQVDGSVVFHHDPVYDGGHEAQNTLKYLVENYGDVPHFTVSKTQQFQFPGLLRRVNPDFVIIRHPGLAPVAAKMGIPSLVMGDEHFPLAYDGIIRTGNILIAILARKKFNNVLKRHVKLPYTDWWLSQEDQFILAKHPEILDDEYDGIKTEIKEAAA
jgi:nitrogenase molybdenum-iron protein alpha chain